MNYLNFLIFKGITIFFVFSNESDNTQKVCSATPVWPRFLCNCSDVRDHWNSGIIHKKQADNFKCATWFYLGIKKKKVVLYILVILCFVNPTPHQVCMNTPSLWLSLFGLGKKEQKKKKTHTCKNLYKRWYIYYSGLFLWKFPFYEMLNLMMVAMWGEKKKSEEGCSGNMQT